MALPRRSCRFPDAPKASRRPVASRLAVRGTNPRAATENLRALLSAGTDSQAVKILFPAYPSSRGTLSLSGAAPLTELSESLLSTRGGLQRLVGQLGWSIELLILDLLGRLDSPHGSCSWKNPAGTVRDDHVDRVLRIGRAGGRHQHGRQENWLE